MQQHSKPDSYIQFLITLPVNFFYLEYLLRYYVELSYSINMLLLSACSLPSTSAIIYCKSSLWERQNNKVKYVYVTILLRCMTDILSIIGVFHLMMLKLDAM